MKIDSQAGREKNMNALPYDYPSSLYHLASILISHSALFLLPLLPSLSLLKPINILVFPQNARHHNRRHRSPNLLLVRVSKLLLLSKPY